MIQWIRVDDFTRVWPEGSVIAFFPNKLATGSGRALAAWRDEAGKIVADDETAGTPTHFFYLPPEPQNDR